MSKAVQLTLKELDYAVCCENIVPVSVHSMRTSTKHDLTKEQNISDKNVSQIDGMLVCVC